MYGQVQIVDECGNVVSPGDIGGSDPQVVTCLEDIKDILANQSITVTPDDAWANLFDGLSSEIVASIEAQTTAITDSLQEICDKLDAGITVNAVQSGEWNVTVDGEVSLDADTISAIADAIADADLTVTIGGQDVTLDVNITNDPLTVTLSQDSLDALEDLTLTVEIANADPIEITGSVTIDGDVSIDWTGMQDALNGLEVEITNFDDLVSALEDATLTVTVDGEVVIDQDQIDSLITAITDVVRTDFEPISSACLFDADGNVIPDAMFFREKQYNSLGAVVSDNTVISQFDLATNTWGAYTVPTGAYVGKCAEPVDTTLQDVLTDCDGGSETCDYETTFKSSGLTSILTDKGEALSSTPFDFTPHTAGQNASNNAAIATAQAEAQAFLDANGGGTITIEYLSESFVTITVTGSTCVLVSADDDSNPGPHVFTKSNCVGGGVASKALRTKGCNDDRRDNLLEAIANSPSGDNTDVIAAIAAQTAALLAENCKDVDTPLTLVQGANTSVPAGMKSVTIYSTSGTTTIDGVYRLGGGRLPRSQSYGTDRGNCVNELLPAYAISGGTWQWTALSD